MLRIALFIGILIAFQGIVGLIAPGLFVDIVRIFQTPPVIYLAAVIRFAVGVVLILAAPQSRVPLAVRGMGAMIAIGGAITPFWGIEIAHLILGWWAQGGDMIVRAWAFGSLLIGGFILYAASQVRST
jgi:hypothetical protein